MIIEKIETIIIEDIKMNYLFNVQKNNEFCILTTENNDPYFIKITEVIETDDIDVWCKIINHLYQKYKIPYHYYVGSDEYYTILKSILPNDRDAVIRKTTDDLSFNKLIKKLKENLIELPSDYEYLKNIILSDDIKIDALKLASYIDLYCDGKPIYNRQSEREVYKSSIFGELSLESVLKLFE